MANHRRALSSRQLIQSKPCYSQCYATPNQFVRVLVVG